jgi:N-acetylglutamate synthase-like GNAT family acetyltransferase
MDSLRWIRIFSIEYLPRYLVEQIRDRSYNVDQFLEFQKINLVVKENGELQLNPFNHLHVLVDKENVIKGFVWFTIEPLTKDIFIQNYSVDKEYWNKGTAVNKLTEKILEIHEKAGLNKIFWATKYPKHSMRYGFKRSKNILMEYNPENDTNFKLKEK